jgi:hypothetical protein
MIRRHRWSILSIAITVGALLTVGAYVQYQYRFHHVTNFRDLSVFGGWAIILSVSTACVAMFKERGSILSMVALVLGMFSTAFYVV